MDDLQNRPVIVEIDLHGYHPDDICGEPLKNIILQAWEIGAQGIQLIHGHGRGRGISPGFVNTNTGYFGLRIRRELRHNTELRRWIKYTTLNCKYAGASEVKLKPNPAPSRTDFNESVLPERSFRN
jgi:hypothetical protein